MLEGLHREIMAVDISKIENEETYRILLLLAEWRVAVIARIVLERFILKCLLVKLSWNNSIVP